MKTRKKADATALIYRTHDIEKRAIDVESRTVELAFSSETEKVERWDGIEILDHGAGSIRLGRLQNKAPLLMDHNARDQIGVVESVTVGADRLARSVVRFGKSGRASEIFDDLVDGIRTKVSVGYMVYKRMETDEGTDQKPVYRVTDWEPHEISIVSIAADDDVGVGRASASSSNSETNEATIMSDEENAAAAAATRAAAAAPAPAAAAPAFDEKAARAEILKTEQLRSNAIRELGKRRNMPELADKFVADGKSLDEFRSALLDSMDDESAAAPHRHANVDLNAGEAESYSIVRALRAKASGDWSKAGLERELSDEIAKQLGRDTEGVFVPSNLRNSPELQQRMGRISTRAPLTADAVAAGGYTVATNVMSLIEMLRNRMMVRSMGARVMSGLVGPLSFPTQATGAAFTWTAEDPGSDLTDSDLTTGQVAMSPKSGQTSSSYSKQLLAQSSLDIEALVRDDLTKAAAIGLDLAALHGTGASNQPTGVIATSGIGDVAGGTNGLAPTWANIVALETAVAIDNADIGSLGYLTNAKVRGQLRVTEKASSTGQFVWEDGNEPGFGMLAGYRAGVSNQVSSTLTKGTASGICSAIFFGNWDDLLIGEWGALEILVDPYALKKQGMVEVTSFVMADIAVRHAQSFAVMQDALTP